MSLSGGWRDEGFIVGIHLDEDQKKKPHKGFLGSAKRGCIGLSLLLKIPFNFA